jgi:hypothetical protein
MCKSTVFDGVMIRAEDVVSQTETTNMCLNGRLHEQVRNQR